MAALHSGKMLKSNYNHDDLGDQNQTDETRYDWPGEIPVTEWLAGSQQEVIMVIIMLQQRVCKSLT